jgi:hypothetical protein
LTVQVSGSRETFTEPNKQTANSKTAEQTPQKKQTALFFSSVENFLFFVESYTTIVNYCAGVQWRVI